MHECKLVPAQNEMIKDTGAKQSIDIRKKIYEHILHLLMIYKVLTEPRRTDVRPHNGRIMLDT